VNVRRKYVIPGAVGIVLAGSLSMASLSAEADSPAPTKEDAYAALAHIDQDQATIKAYLDSLSAPTPTPTGSESPSPTATTVPPTTEPPVTVSPTVEPTTASPPPTATTPPAGVSRASGLPWSSGVNPQSQTAARVNAFVSFRGQPVDNISIFPARDSWTTLSDPGNITAALPASFNATRDDLVMTLPLWPGNMSVSNTGTKAQWENLANVIKAKDPNALVRLGWEMNLPGMYWNLNSSNKTQWIASYNTAVGYMKGVAPDLRFVWNPNKGNDQTTGCTGSMNCSRSAFQSVKANVYAYGIDSYDSWPPDNSDANSSTHLNSLLGESLSYAKANAKKFAVPEWGVACNVSGCQWSGNAGGDNARYINDYMTFFRNNAPDMAFEAYFDEPASYIRSALSVTPIGTAAPAAYKAKIAAYTAN